jgi:hypothetical protein
MSFVKFVGCEWERSVPGLLDYNLQVCIGSFNAWNILIEVICVTVSEFS